MTVAECIGVAQADGLRVFDYHTGERLYEGDTKGATLCVRGLEVVESIMQDGWLTALVEQDFMPLEF